eukprot:scaffold13283_cov71-Skeletonema_marinoi.AAC.1
MILTGSYHGGKASSFEKDDAFIKELELFVTDSLWCYLRLHGLMEESSQQQQQDGGDLGNGHADECAENIRNGSRKNLCPELKNGRKKERVLSRVFKKQYKAREEEWQARGKNKNGKRRKAKACPDPRSERARNDGAWAPPSTNPLLLLPANPLLTNRKDLTNTKSKCPGAVDRSGECQDGCPAAAMGGVWVVTLVKFANKPNFGKSPYNTSQTVSLYPSSTNELQTKPF